MVSASQLEILLSSWKSRSSLIRCRVLRVGTVAFNFRGEVTDFDRTRIVIMDSAQNKLDITLQPNTRFSFTGDMAVETTLSDGTQVRLEKEL
jgi:hypothetical protein